MLFKSILHLKSCNNKNNLKLFFEIKTRNFVKYNFYVKKMSEPSSSNSTTVSENATTATTPKFSVDYNNKNLKFYNNFKGPKYDTTRYSSFEESQADRKRKLKERRAEKSETKDIGFSEDTLKQTDYYYENGLRKVYPYWFGWNTFVKERWLGRTLLDIYETEFFRATASFSVKNLIESGKIRVNGHIKSLDYKLKNGDRLTHTKHRHEIPVVADPIKILHEDENYLVLDKPCSIPMHPCGKYRYNSLGIILVKEFGYSNLRSKALFLIALGNFFY